MFSLDVRAIIGSMTKSKNLRTRTAYTPELKTKILDLYIEGMPIIEMHKQFGWHQASVAKIIKESGVNVVYGTRKGVRLTPEQEQEAVQMYLDGKSAKEISFLFGCSTSKVWDLLKERKKATRKAEAQATYQAFIDKMGSATQVCNKCNVSKPIEEFSRGRVYRNNISPVCKECHKLYPSRQDGGDARRVSDHRNRNKQFLWDYYCQHPCMDCGESDPMVLVPDHVRGDKFKGVSVMVHNGFSIKKIEEELAKCDIVCQNCHHRREAIKQGWYAGINTSSS